MADKSERILVLTTHNKDGECECVMQDGCHVNDSCAICNVGMTRQEAIERMAKALKKVIYILSEEACIEGCEAALNALLEGK